jgi:thiol-disulfide isomerase/thioredoxin
VVAVIVLVAVTTPLGNPADGPGTVDPHPTQYIIRPAPPGGPACEGARTRVLGGAPRRLIYQLADLDGKPTRLADLRGKAVWINFWASWCPPCQQETPIIRDLAERYRAAGLVVVGIAVQETSPADIRAYCRAV